MRRSTLHVLAALAGALLLVPLGGCVVAADLVNPAFFEQLGLDATTIIGQSGFVVVAFSNETDQQARFHLYFAVDATDLRAGVDEIFSDVFPGDMSSEPVPCPFELLSFGEVDDNFSANTTGAVLTAVTAGQDAQAESTVEYAGAPLIAGVDFVCGDLIDVQLYQTTTGTADNQQNQYAFRIRVIPGR
ncbi:MAG: hypothetical protein KKB50_14120 [Planctomycetes bacterium]|nr:hypothetical protein [Planctomycetota bacterium]